MISAERENIVNLSLTASPTGSEYCRFAFSEGYNFVHISRFLVLRVATVMLNPSEWMRVEHYFKSVKYFVS